MLNLINKTIIKASERWKKVRLAGGPQDPKNDKAVYSLSCLFALSQIRCWRRWQPRKTNGTREKISKKNSLEKPKRREGHRLTREKIFRQWPLYPHKIPLEKTQTNTNSHKEKPAGLPRRPLLPCIKVPLLPLLWDGSFKRTLKNYSFPVKWMGFFTPGWNKEKAFPLLLNRTTYAWNYMLNSPHSFNKYVLPQTQK